MTGLEFLLLMSAVTGAGLWALVIFTLWDLRR